MFSDISDMVTTAKTTSLSTLLPATSAVLTYLYARLGLSNDLPLINAFIQIQYEQYYLERRDELNLFYILEKLAVGRPGAGKSTPKTAERTFIVYQNREWTFKQTYEIILKYGNWLKTKLGIDPGEVVAVDFMNCDVFVFIWFGLWAIGAKPAFVNYNLKGASLVHCVQASTARVLLADRKLQPIVSTVVDKLTFPSEESNNATATNHPVRTVIFSPELEDKILGMEGLRLSNEVRAGQRGADMAALIFTSGTTGLPKPAIVSWTKMSAASLFVAKAMSLGPRDRIYTCMPLYHSSAAVLALCAALRAASTICIGHKFSAGTFWFDVQSCNATIIQYVGETCRYLLNVPPSALDKQHRLRLAYGNGLRPEVWDKFKSRFGIPTIFEFYGATESPGALWNFSTNNFSAGAIGWSGTICQLLLSSRLAIIALEQPSSSVADTNIPYRDPVTKFCRRVPANTPGELLMKLNANDTRESFQGYFRNDGATSSKILRNVFEPGDAWFRTGDLVRADTQGRYYFSDRLGDTFRWKAENVSTTEVSGALGSLPVIADVNVYGVTLPGHDGRCGCAAVVFKGSTRGDVLEDTNGQTQDSLTVQALDEIARCVEETLPYHARPIFVRVSDNIQATGTNKQLKNDLRNEGIDPSAVSASSGGRDKLFWLKGNQYVPFTQADWENLQIGKVKL